jgi:hypothetical protein
MMKRRRNCRFITSTNPRVLNSICLTKLLLVARFVTIDHRNQTVNPASSSQHPRAIHSQEHEPSSLQEAVIVIIVAESVWRF